MNFFQCMLKFPSSSSILISQTFFFMMQLFCSKWYHKASPQDTQYFYIQEKNHDKPFKFPKKIFFQSFSIINNSKTYNSCTLCKHSWNKRWMGTCGKKGVKEKKEEWKGRLWARKRLVLHPSIIMHVFHFIFMP